MASREMTFRLPKYGVEAVAELFDEAAPRTCDALVDHIGDGLEVVFVTSQWSGRVLIGQLDPAAISGDLAAVGLENATILPEVGDVLWRYFPVGSVRPVRTAEGFIALAYGREVLLRGALGESPSNLWARFVDGSEEFLGACARLQLDGVATMELRMGSGA